MLGKYSTAKLIPLVCHQCNLVINVLNLKLVIFFLKISTDLKNFRGKITIENSYVVLESFSFWWLIMLKESMMISKVEAL